MRKWESAGEHFDRNRLAAFRTGKIIHRNDLRNGDRGVAMGAMDGINAFRTLVFAFGMMDMEQV
jgi:hypothetical protein